MTSNRRKRPLPVRLNNEEQEKLAWNMADLIKNNGVAKPGSLLHDAPSSGLENVAEEKKGEAIAKKRGRFSRAKRNLDCDKTVELKLQSSLPDCWHCKVGSIEVSLHHSCNINQTASTFDSDGNETFLVPITNMTEVKVTLNMESIIDNEVGHDFIIHEDNSTKECLPSSLRTLSMKGFTSVPSDTLSALENLQEKGVVSLIINPKTSVFDNSWAIDICLCEKGLSKMGFASKDVIIRNNDKLIQKLMKFFFKGICDNGSEKVEYLDKETEFTTLYETVMRRRKEKGKTKSRKMETFVACSKTVDESCKIGKVRTSAMNMSGQEETKNCENYEKHLRKYSRDESLFDFENKNKILDTEIQGKQRLVILEDEHISKPMEVQAGCEHDHEVTGLLYSKPLCDFQHEHLKPTLRQYQRRAVQWMIDKENSSDSTKAGEENDLHVLWRRCVTLDKKVIFFNPYNGRLTTEHFKPPVLPPGGILADEMGLGKTVEVLACILNNPMAGGEVRKNDKPTENAESKATPGARPEHVLESESTLPLGGLVNPSDALSQRYSTQEKTLSQEPEQDVPYQIVACSPQISSLSVPQLFGTSASSCASEVASATIAPPSMVSSKLPETPAVMAPSDTCTTFSRPSQEKFPFSALLPSTDLCSSELPSASVSHSFVSSVTPCITSEGPSETISMVPEQIASFSSLSPSSASCSLESTPTYTPTTSLVISSVTPGPSETISMVPEQIASFSSLSPTMSVLSSTESIPPASIQPSDTASVLPSTSLSTPSLSTYVAASDTTSILTSTLPSSPTQMVNLSTALQPTSLMESHTTLMPPSLPSKATSIVLSSSLMPSSLLTIQQEASSTLKSSASKATTCLQSTCVSPTLSSPTLSSPTSSVCSSKPSQDCPRPPIVHSNRFAGTETPAAKAWDTELIIEKSPQESDLLETKKWCKAESSNHPSSLRYHENSTVFAHTDKNGPSPKPSWESLEPVLNTKSNVKTAPIPKNDQFVDSGIRRSLVDTDSRPATLAIKCICGSTQSSADDVLLKCTECTAVSHASCLGHSVTCRQTESFLCPNCAVNRPPIPSRATLIISPATIAHQWVEEITRHTTTSALRLLVYEGVAKQGFVQPDMLADHDIIITTYATLRADFHHLGTQQGRSLRYQKRYMALPSPLTAIKFWRICLDEAQMVESTTAKAAEMALRLDCVNRWCVTGTPIQKGLEDLYGLLLFLGVYPYCQKAWWDRLLCQPYLGGNKEPMYDTLADILWRTAKKDVLDEIHLPSQTEVVVRLNFTPVEEHFYRRQHEECSASINLMLKRFGSQDVKLNSLDRNTVHKMLIPLLRLRQACCHPQAVRGGFLSMQKSTMTMDQLLEVLITRAKLECEEAHRQLLFAINGLAGIHAIKEEWPEAVDLYRLSMQSWMEHQDKFRTDALQKLHTLHNLSDLLSAGHSGCSHTLRDDKLKDEADELVKQYMSKPNTQVQAALDNLTFAQTNIEELLEKVHFHTPWWLLALNSVKSSGLGHELVNRVREELSAVSTDHSSILNSFTDIHGLGFTVTTKLDVVESTHSTLVQALDQLRSYPTPETVHATAVCCLRSRPHRTSQATRCKFCEVDDIFTEYESRLFGHQGMKGIMEEEEASNIDWHRHGNTGGLRAETETEKVLKNLFGFIKSHRLVPSVHHDARNHLAFMEARRKEFKFLRNVWFASRERVSALDELEMCTTKLRLALPGEPVNEDENHVIRREQVEHQKLKFISDRVIAGTELRKKLGQYLYLTNLAKSQKFNEGENPDPCPVCTKNLGKEWSVFSCGHCYCCQCVWVLLRQAGIGPRNRDIHIKCPICRFPTLAREISYVCTGKEGSQGDKSISVKGSHSTKVEAVVRALLKIKAEDETTKCLVFSTWQDVLELIGKALQENDINFRLITCGGKRFQTDLHVFKEDPDVPVLLLPLQSGSNGLNIIEATHVLLVEPALNPAHELQAVGRVHRIGQTRPTFVHRFIINNTVESRMFSLLNGKSRDVVRTGSKDTENSALTTADLTSLFREGNDANQIEIGSDEHDDVAMIT